jgi:hypothetical protein
LQGPQLLGSGRIESKNGTPTKDQLVSWMRVTDSEGKTEVVGQLPPDDPEAHRFYEVRI